MNAQQPLVAKAYEIVYKVAGGATKTAQVGASTVGSARNFASQVLGAKLILAVREVPTVTEVTL